MTEEAETRSGTAATPAGRRGRRYEWLVAGLVLLAAVWYFGAAALVAYLQQRQASTSFVPVSATVVEARVMSRGSPAASSGASSRPYIVYSYSVAGKTYRADRYFYLGDGWRDASEAQAVVAGFPPGSTVRAYVNPDQPSDSVLDRSRPPWGVLLYLVPLILVGLGAIGLGLRKTAPRR